MEIYLESSKYINWQDPDILSKAKSLSANLNTKEEIVEACYNFVRDEIKHSGDYKINTTTCIASDVLKYATGWCYSKSHLLAALLRANDIPAGICYQRLTVSDNKPPFCLHGLNAVYLESYGWYRLDPRGNKKGIEAKFSPPYEQLAFPIIIEGETDLPEIWSEPLPIIIDSLKPEKGYREVIETLPDIQLFIKK